MASQSPCFPDLLLLPLYDEEYLPVASQEWMKKHIFKVYLLISTESQREKEDPLLASHTTIHPFSQLRSPACTWHAEGDHRMWTEDPLIWFYHHRELCHYSRPTFLKFTYVRIVLDYQIKSEDGAVTYTSSPVSPITNISHYSDTCHNSKTNIDTRVQILFKVPYLLLNILFLF